MSCGRAKCKKCYCAIWDESSGSLCDNCNMDLIAQNLAAELSQHEIHRELQIEPTEPELEADGAVEPPEPEPPSDAADLPQQPRKRKPPPATPSDESGEDEGDAKRVDSRPEPMRTRAKQHDAVMKQQDDDAVQERGVVGEGDDAADEEDDVRGPQRRLTRKAFSDIEKYKHPTYEPTHAKSRRTKQFKAKQVYKAPTSQASIYTSDYVFHKGRYLQTGDVVLLRDTHRPGNFFAQITSFLTDQYCHKCATIQWLLPTKQSPATAFDPTTYFLGYLDETPRPLASLLPVMHLPSDYYRFYKTPYPPPAPDPLHKHYLYLRTQPVSLDSLL